MLFQQSAQYIKNLENCRMFEHAFSVNRISTKHKTTFLTTTIKFSFRFVNKNLTCNRFLLSLIDSFLVIGVVIFPIFPAILQLNVKISVLPAARYHGLWSNLLEDGSQILW